MQMSRRVLLTIPLIAAAVLAGCDLFGDDKSESKVVTESVIVANGGNFSDQNGSLSFYDPGTGSVSASADLGGFAQAIAMHNEEIYVLLNTFSTGRISVLGAATGAVERQIQGIPAPRGIAFVDDEQALVTNLSPFGEAGPEPAVVSTIDLETGSVDAEAVEVGIYPEGIAVLGDRAYVANSGNLGDGRTLSVIDVESKTAIGSIDLGCDGPNEVFADPDDEIIVVCEGKVVYNDDFTEIIEQTPGQIVVVNATTESVATRSVLPTPAGSENGSQTAYFDATAGELYVIDSASGSVYRFGTDSHAVTATLHVPEADDLVGLSAVAYDRSTQSLYVARLARGAGGFPDFSAAGAVVVLDRSGKAIDRFAVGPTPSHIALFRSTR